MFNNFNDSDCQIIDKDITTISINSTIEEGELDEETIPAETIFEIKFNNLEQFNKLGNIVINATKSALNKIFGDHFYTYNIDTVNEETKIEFYATDDKTKCNNSIKNAVSNVVQKYIENQKTITETSTSSTDGVENKEKSPDYFGIDLLFEIDTKPSTKNDINKIPSYKRSIKEVLNDEQSRMEKKKKEEEACLRGIRPKINCFNCDSNEHSLRDCPKPRNMMRINRAKKARGMRQERYHVDAEQRFSHLKPGHISDNLRKALGIGKNELPFFYYRMRKFGYPPGWLEDAKVANSGLSLFDEKGTKDLETNEDGNVAIGQQHKYNVSKIIDFPGFNYDPGKCYYDDFHYHMVPPMSKFQMKDEYIKSLGNNVIKGYKRKKLQTNLTSTAQSHTTNDSIEMFDMELEDEKEEEDNVNIVFSRPSPSTDLINTDINQKPIPEIPPLPPQTTNPTTPPSPSLADLEQQQLLLLKELQHNTTICIDDSLIDEVIELDNTPIIATTTTATTITPTTPIAIPNNKRKATDSIQASYEGTPILKFSPYDKLPNSEKFQEGVSDVLNFENLPDATGHYEQMKTVIKRIRKTVQVLYDEE